MPICIECCYPVKTLYTEYAAAGDGGASGGVRLTQCPRCKKFADRYIEFDFVIVFIDLVLIKPQVYRHLLFNSLARDDDRFDPSVVRLGILLLLFDVYLTWARIEKQSSHKSHHMSRLSDHSIGVQYIFFQTVILSALSTLAFHFSIRLLGTSPYSPLHLFNILPSHPPSAYLSTTTTPPTPNNGLAGTATPHNSTTNSTSNTPPLATTNLPTYIPPNPSIAHTRPNAISTALLVSSSTKLFPILMVIWDYDVPAAARSLGWAVVANNVEALKILLDCSYWTAGSLAGCGAAVRWLVGRSILWAVGLEDEILGFGGVMGMGTGTGLVGWWEVMVEVGKEWGGMLGFGMLL